MSQGSQDRIPQCRSEGAIRLTALRRRFPRPDGSATSGALLRAECTGRGLAKWSERDSRAVCVRAYAYALPSHVRVTHALNKREYPRERKSVGGSIANHFLSGRVRSSNNRILVRAASGKGCTPLYVRLERTATGKEEKKVKRQKKKEKKKRGDRKVVRCSNNTCLYSFHKGPAVSRSLLRME